MPSSMRLPSLPLTRQKTAASSESATASSDLRVWVNEFSRVSQEPGFDLGKYIEKIGKNDGEGTEAAARPHRGQDAGHD